MVRSKTPTKFFIKYNLTEKRFNKIYKIEEGYFYNYNNISYPFVSISRQDYNQMILNEQTSELNKESSKILIQGTVILVIATIVMVFLAFFNLMVSIAKWRKLHLIYKIIFVVLLAWLFVEMLKIIGESIQNFA